MPNWKKLIVSGSDATLNSLVVSGDVTASAFKGDGSQLTNIISASYAPTILPAGIVSSSQQIQLVQIAGTTFSASNYTFPENLTVVGTLIAQEFQTEYVTSSIIYESGSTKFGDTIDDTHQFTGSLHVFGEVVNNLTASYAVTASYVEGATGDWNTLINKPDGLVSSSTQINTGSFNGTFVGDGSGLTNLPTNNVGINIDTYTFVGTGTTTNYILSQSYDVSSLIVSIDGLTQTKITDYTMSGTTLSFAEVPPSQSSILIRTLTSAVENATGSFTGSFSGGVTFSQLPNIRLKADNHLFIGDGTTVLYTLSQSYDPSILTVSVDGLVNAVTDDYTVSSNQLTFTFAPPSGSNVLIKGITLALT